jgi:hypothetical protein
MDAVAVARASHERVFFLDRKQIPTLASFLRDESFRS